VSLADTREPGRNARVIGKLTTIRVQQAKPASHPKHTKLYGDGGGLFLQVSPNGAKSWIFRFKEAGRLRVMGLGPTHTISLAEARDKARECRKLRLDAKDPIEVRKAARAAAKLEAAKTMTFRECAEAYIAAKAPGWRSAQHAKQWAASLKDYVYPVFDDLPVQAIDLGLVLKAIEPVWKTRTETASRVRGRIESVLGWATVRGYREGDNPARWKGHLENLLPERSKVRRIVHHAALPYPEIGAFMAGLRRQQGVAARAFEFLILTAARTGEVTGARWSEINVDDRVWVIPAERMKAGKEHRVPLSDAAMAVIERMRGSGAGQHLFPGRRGRPLSGAAMLMLLRRMGRGDLTVHGFRSSFRDWAAERTAFPAEIAEMALAHAVGSAVEQAYRRSDMFQKRRQLAEAWATFCNLPATGSGEVVPIRAGAE
jgi:integrase